METPSVGRTEAVSFGALMATIMGGSVILYLAAVPFVYSEDFAWSIPLTVGSLFALLGVLERPTKWRVLASGVLILCTNLDRSPPGWACSIAAIAIAGWFALGRDEASNRRWALPMFAVGMVPFLASCVVTYAKFGIPVGLPMADQVWASGQRPPPVFPGRQRREGVQLRLPAQHPVGLFPTFRDPLSADSSPSSARPVRPPHGSPAR